tara:strand:- start:22638 stop:23309 length:672 start_codon:yes stop_codon:yes gene_type:complete
MNNYPADINVFKKISYFITNNIKYLIILFSFIFLVFIIFQFFSIYSSSKIQQNSIVFFNAQNTDQPEVIKKTLKDLSDKKDFYGTLAKLQLIDINFRKENYEDSIELYYEIMEDNNLDNVYKSAIAVKASFQFINLNFENLSDNFLSTIEKLISYINDDLESYHGFKLELVYLTHILSVQKNNLDYKNDLKAIDKYNEIMNSELTSSSTKERIKKIHEFFYYN